MKYKVGDEVIFLFYTVAFIGIISSKTHLLNGTVVYSVSFGMSYNASVAEKYILTKISNDESDDIIYNIKDLY